MAKTATVTVEIRPRLKTLRACISGIKAAIGVLERIEQPGPREKLRRTLSRSLAALKKDDALQVTTGERRKA